MTKKEFSEYIKKIISSNSSDSAKYARELKQKVFELIDDKEEKSG